MIRAVLLDMGGILLSLANARGLPDSRLDWRGREALLRAIRDAGGRATGALLDEVLFGPWRRDYDRRYEIGHEATWEPHLERLRRRAGAELADLDLLRTWFRPYGEHLTPVPGALDALQALSARRLPLAICSNVPLPGALYREILERHGLTVGIESYHYSYDERSRKPSPQMLRRALEAFGVPPEEAVMVGDRRSSDVAAGRAAGTATIWLRTEDGGGPAADLTIESMAELAEAVTTLEARP
jgi:HAD superfamily hydrolase (TIGR01509 family)